MNKEIENIKIELETGNTDKDSKIDELNLQVEELNLEIEEFKQQAEELNQQLITVEDEKKESLEKIEVERRENKDSIELLQMELEEKNGEKEKLELKISSLEEKAEEINHYVEAMQQELAKAFDVARINVELLEEKEKHLVELEKNIEIKTSEYEELKNELEQVREEYRVNEERNKELENEEISKLKEELNEKEENLKIILSEKDSIENDRNEKADYLNELQNELEKLLEELKLSKEKVTALESGEIKELNEENQTLKEKIAEKEEAISLVNIELENLKVEKDNFELNFMTSNDVKEEIVIENRELKAKVEEIQVELEKKNKELEEKELDNEIYAEEKEAQIIELNVCIEELNEELEASKNSNSINEVNDDTEVEGLKEQFEEISNKNIDLVESYEKLNQKFVRAVHKQYDFRLMTANMLGKILEENNKLTTELKKIKVHAQIKENVQIKENIEMKLNDYHEEPRVDIKNLFGNTSKEQENSGCDISNFINSLEDRNEFSQNEEKIGKTMWTQEILGLREEIEEIHDANLSENISDDLETEKVENKVEKITKFIDYREFFSKDKVKEYLDFLKFMLPRAIEVDSPLLEKEILYFSVSFAFYFYNGGDFWELLLNKLDIAEEEKEGYRNYLRKQLDVIFKEHDYCQLVDEKGDRVGASIVMHSILPVNQMNEYLDLMRDIYVDDLDGIIDKDIFEKILDEKLKEEKVDAIIKAADCFEKTNKMDWFVEYSYELMKEIDATSRGIAYEESSLNKLVVKKIQSIII